VVGESPLYLRFHLPLGGSYTAPGPLRGPHFYISLPFSGLFHSIPMAPLISFYGAFRLPRVCQRANPLQPDPISVSSTSFRSFSVSFFFKSEATPGTELPPRPFPSSLASNRILPVLHFGRYGTRLTGVGHSSFDRFTTTFSSPFFPFPPF